MFDEYVIPEEIKAMFTDEFCKTLRKALFRVWKDMGLDTTAEFGPVQLASTGGYVVAFWTACAETNNMALFDYWDALPWYESDVFDDELMHYLMENGYLLGYMGAIIAEKLHIPIEKLAYCDYCGHYFTKDMGVESCDECGNVEWKCYRCATGEEDTYYVDQYDKMEAYRKNADKK